MLKTNLILNSNSLVYMYLFVYNLKSIDRNNTACLYGTNKINIFFNVTKLFNNLL